MAPCLPSSERRRSRQRGILVLARRPKNAGAKHYARNGMDRTLAGARKVETSLFVVWSAPPKIARAEKGLLRFAQDVSTRGAIGRGHADGGIMQVGHVAQPFLLFVHRHRPRLHR